MTRFSILHVVFTLVSLVCMLVGRQQLHYKHCLPFSRTAYSTLRGAATCASPTISWQVSVLLTTRPGWLHGLFGLCLSYFLTTYGTAFTSGLRLERKIFSVVHSQSDTVREPLACGYKQSHFATTAVTPLTDETCALGSQWRWKRRPVVLKFTVPSRGVCFSLWWLSSPVWWPTS